MKSKLLNLALYEVGWFACVLGAAQNAPWLGVLVGLVLIGVHLGLERRRGVEAGSLVVAGLVGGVIDTIQIRSGTLELASAGPLPGIAPPWILIMWMQFATTFHYCLAWLLGRYRLCVLLGLFGGPLAYLAGSAVGACGFPAGRPLGLGVLGALWAVALPVLVWASGRIGGSESRDYRPFRTLA